ncbi:MAG: hypothetical protein ACOCPY_02490 [Halorubrum sp.]
MSDSSSSSDVTGRAGSARVDREALAAAVDRYHRIDRVVSWTLALLVAGVFLGATAALSFWRGVFVAGVLVVALRVPLYRRSGSYRLRTETAPETVAREFASATPPVLALQWGVADEVVDATDADATYEFSYLFGLRSASVTVATERRDVGPGETVVDVEGTASGRPWGSYEVTVRESGDGETVVDVELEPVRRFDLRRLPQGWVAERYYADALAAQGYEVVEREVSSAV